MSFWLLLLPRFQVNYFFLVGRALKRARSSDGLDKVRDKFLQIRDGFGPDVGCQANQAWTLAHSEQWKHLFEVVVPITTQHEFDRLMADTIGDSKCLVRRLVIVSRLVRTDTPEFDRVRQGIMAGASDCRVPKTQLNRFSDPILGGGINDVKKRDGFGSTPAVVYYR